MLFFPTLLSIYLRSRPITFFPCPCTNSMSQAAPLSRDPDLWIEDGNLVVQAAPRLFRVHRGILASNSGFFRGMVDFPESRVQNTCDGVPLITLHDDDARDVAQFLKAIYIFEYVS